MITRIDCDQTMARATVHNGVIYFCGHVADCPGAPMKQQAERLLARYEELLSMYGSSKDHLIFATVYVSDLSQKEAFNAVWDAWLTPGCAPARVCVQCGLPQGYAVEIALTAECLQA